MKTFLVAVMWSLILAGCGDPGPIISKSRLGNLEINVFDNRGETIKFAEVYVDGIFVGNASSHKPILHLKKGKRIIRVGCRGFMPYEKVVVILGEPNHQVLNIKLQEEQKNNGTNQ